METIEAIQSRRSINFFDEKKAVPIETIMRLVELAAASSTSLMIVSIGTAFFSSKKFMDLLD